MTAPNRLTVAQAFRIAEDEVDGCLTSKPPQPTVRSQSSLVRADACEVAVRENVKLRAAIQRACDESDYCCACDCHPSHGHADDCPLRGGNPT
jgi:hypothetical protein